MTIPFVTEDPVAEKPKSKPVAHIDYLEQRSETKQECSKDEKLSEVITSSPVECVIDNCSQHIKKLCRRNEVKERSSKNIVMRQYFSIAKSMHHRAAYFSYAIFNLVSFSICKAIEIFSDIYMSKVKVSWKKEKQECGNKNKESYTGEWILKGMCRQFYKFPLQILQIFPFLPQKIRYSNKEPTKPYADLNYEGSRFATFATFPDKPGVFVTRLAEAGFHYEGNSDEVACHSCGIKYKDWKRHDSPSEIHRKLSPTCTFVKNKIKSTLKQEMEFITGACGSDEHFVNCQTHNESSTLGVTSESKKESKQSRHDPSVITPLKHIATDNTVVNQRQEVGFSRNDTTSLIRIPQDTPTIANSVTQQSNKQFPNSNKDPATERHIEQTLNLTERHFTRDVESRTNSLGICLAKPRYQTYAVRSARIDSFRSWPKSLTQSPEEMTLAGFFFTGIEDHCRCFFCGGGLKNWETYDRPWVEHARWYPNCAFVKHCKGEKFIKDIHENKISSNISEHQVTSHQINNTEINHGLNESPAVNHPAVASVSELGFHSTVITDAFRFLTNSGEKDITGSKLLEAIFQLEDANGNMRGTQQNNVSNGPEQITSSTNVSQALTAGAQSSENKSVHHGETEAAELDVQVSIKSLEEENQSLRDQQTCKICLDEPIAIVFLPCGHLAACKNCAPALRRCPICRSFIKGTVKAIMC